MLSKISEIVKKRTNRLVFTIGAILIIVLALGIGLNIGAKVFSRPPITINSELLPTSSFPTADNSQSGYVASINGQYYYPVDCSSANRIKEENKMFFNTKEEAESQGYKPSTSCTD